MTEEWSRFINCQQERNKEGGMKPEKNEERGREIRERVAE